MLMFLVLGNISGFAVCRIILVNERMHYIDTKLQIQILELVNAVL